MKYLYATTAILGAAMLGVPAFAQSSGTQSSESADQDTQIQAISQQDLRQNLEEAGFTNIRIVDAAYLVQAQDPQGDQVMMLLNPPERGSQASAQSSTMSDQQSGQQQASVQSGGQLQSSYRSFKQANIDAGQSVVGDMTADELIDNQVVDRSGQQLGTVHDLLLGDGDQVQAALIETGGGNYVAVSADRLEVEQGAGGEILLDMSESELEQQPTFEQNGDSWSRTQSQ